jgi:uncharacterized RDD family membrane protein YckC
MFDVRRSMFGVLATVPIPGCLPRPLRLTTRPLGTVDITYKIIGGDGREYGPATLEEIRDWISDGRISRETLVWRDDEQRWQRAQVWDELRWDLPHPPPQLNAPPTLARFHPAGFWVRAAACVVDWSILFLIMAFAFQPWIEDFQRSTHELMGTSPEELARDMTRVWALYKTVFGCAGVLALIHLCYFVGCNGRFGCTPGKWVLGLRVVNLDCSPLGFRRAFWRYSGEVLSSLTMGIGYLMVAFNPEKRGLHDVLAGTRVIYWRSLEVE